MIPSRAALVLLATGFLCAFQLNGVSVVKILYSTDNSLPDQSKKLLSVGELEFHLQGRALIDYNKSEVSENKQIAEFVLKNVTLSNEAESIIKKIQNSKGLGYTLRLTFNDKKGGIKGSGELAIQFTYDPQHVNLEYAIGDVMNGNGLLKIILQNKKVLRALDSNHESILRLAHDTCHTTFHRYC